MTATITERVTAGAAFLDEHDPDWWKADVERAIDLDELDLELSGTCVLGQRCPLDVLARHLECGVDELTALDHSDAYFAYVEQLSALDGDNLTLWSRGHGFTLATHGDAPFAWEDLTAEWKRLIEARRSA